MLLIQLQLLVEAAGDDALREVLGAGGRRGGEFRDRAGFWLQAAAASDL